MDQSRAVGRGDTANPNDSRVDPEKTEGTSLDRQVTMGRPRGLSSKLAAGRETPWVQCSPLIPHG